MGGPSKSSAQLARNKSGAFDYKLTCQVWDTKTTEQSRTGTVPAAVVADFLHAVAARGPGSKAGPCGRTDSIGSLTVDVRVPRGNVPLGVYDCAGQWYENGVPLKADDTIAGRDGDEIHPTINARYGALLAAIGDMECYTAAQKAHEKKP